MELKRKSGGTKGLIDMDRYLQYTGLASQQRASGVQFKAVELCAVVSRASMACTQYDESRIENLSTKGD